MDKKDKILITGGKGLIGTALTTKLKSLDYENILSLGKSDCDLMNFTETLNVFEKFKPDFVFHLAAKVFGILGNMKNKGLSFYNNILINTNIVEACRRFDVKKITAMGTVCVYPHPPPKAPLKESMIWDGYPFKAEDSYAHAKRSMLAQLNAYNESYDMKFAFVISSNLYGPNDKFDINNGHVIPSLIKKFHHAKKTSTIPIIWGNGTANRDFMYSEDTACALIEIMNKIEGPVNMGTGKLHSIKEVVEILQDHTGISKVEWDLSKPNGQKNRSYDLSKLASIGFSSKTPLEEGLEKTYEWFSTSKITR